MSPSHDISSHAVGPGHGMSTSHDMASSHGTPSNHVMPALHHMPSSHHLPPCHHNSSTHHMSPSYHTSSTHHQPSSHHMSSTHHLPSSDYRSLSACKTTKVSRCVFEDLFKTLISPRGSSVFLNASSHRIQDIHSCSQHRWPSAGETPNVDFYTTCIKHWSS